MFITRKLTARFQLPVSCCYRSNEQFNNSGSGLLFGGGIQAYLSEQISIRANYTRSTHNHQTNDNVDVYEFVAGVLEQVGTTIYRYNHAIKRDKFSVSMIYNF